MAGIAELYAQHGIILKPVDVSDLLLYAAYQGVAGAAQDWGMKPGAGALAKACTRIFQPDGKEYLQHWLNYRAESKCRRLLPRPVSAEPACSWAAPTKFPAHVEKASEHVSPALCGEVIPTVGKGLGGRQLGVRRTDRHWALQLSALSHLRSPAQAAQHPARHAHPHLRERRLRGGAVVRSAGGGTHPAGIGSRRPTPRAGSSGRQRVDRVVQIGPRKAICLVPESTCR